MSRFKRKGKGGTPAISTASLPDIVFMLLFFFMVTTTMREVTYWSRTPPSPQRFKARAKPCVSYAVCPKRLRQYEAKPNLS